MDAKGLGYSLTFLLIFISTAFTAAQYKDAYGNSFLPLGTANSAGGVAVSDANITALSGTLQDSNSSWATTAPTTPLDYLFKLSAAVQEIFGILLSLAFGWVALLNVVGASLGFAAPLPTLAAFLSMPLLAIELFCLYDMLSQLVFIVRGI